MIERAPSVASADDPAHTAPPVGGPAPGAAGTAHAAALLGRLRAEHRVLLLGQMARVIVHEFNNILTPTVVGSSVALSDNDPAMLRAALERALAGVQRAIAMAARVMSFARPGDTGGSCLVRDALDDALRVMPRPLEQDGVELRVELPDGLRVAAGRDVLGPILLNLLLNARAGLLRGHGFIRLAGSLDGARVHLEVSHHGRSASDRPGVAGRAADATAESDGMTLALEICRLLAEQHGAVLDLTAPEGAAPACRLTWPAAAD